MNSSVLADPRPRIRSLGCRPSPGTRDGGVDRARTYGHAGGLARTLYAFIEGALAQEVVAVPRLFVALDLPASVKRSLEPLGKGLGDVRWLLPEQQHLTLRF